MSHPQIAVFARLANGNAQPVRSIAGQKSLVSRTMHGVAYDDVRDLILVPQYHAQAILVFRGGANGDEAPIRIIQGPKTQLRDPMKLAVDSLHNEIYIPQERRILVFSGDAQGDVPPLRVLEGPDTQLTNGSVGVDPINNVLITVSRDESSTPNQPRSRMLIFDRTGNGNTKPKGVIAGPHSGIIGTQGPIALYPPRQEVIIGMYGPDAERGTEDSYFGVWSYSKYGDLPPLWKFGGPRGITRNPRGIALVPKDKEVVVSDKTVNAVLTWYLPEMF